MKVLMFGWEFPPIISGGLGIACYGIVQGLLAEHCDITFILPSFQKTNSNITLKHKDFHIKTVKALLQPYLDPAGYGHYRHKTASLLYGKDLWSEIKRYAYEAAQIAQNTEHEVIHAHEWLTILAGIEAKKMSHKPLIFHVHALESDRNPLSPNTDIQAIEKYGMEQADMVMAVSEYTKKRIVQEYNINPQKIQVVYNGHTPVEKEVFTLPLRHKNIVLFLGRLTEQKGVHYFIEAAKMILSHRQDIEFIIAGEGNQLPFAVESCAKANISDYVHFTGFLDRHEVNKYFQLCDVYVMPSVSEPFGISCLEAISNDAPVIISKQSGASEVISHALKVDYWDTQQLAEKIMALIDHPALGKEMLVHAKQELANLTWTHAAKEIMQHYSQLIQ